MRIQKRHEKRFKLIFGEALRHSLNPFQQRFLDMKAVTSRVFNMSPGVGTQVYQRSVFPAFVIIAGFRKDVVISVSCIDSFKIQWGCSLFIVRLTNSATSAVNYFLNIFSLTFSRFQISSQSYSCFIHTKMETPIHKSLSRGL